MSFILGVCYFYTLARLFVPSFRFFQGTRWWKLSLEDSYYKKPLATVFTKQRFHQMKTTRD